MLIEGWNVGWDGNWFGNGRDYSFTQAYPDFDIKEVTDYAREKGVRLIGHHETGGNIKVYEEQLADAVKLYGDLGVDRSEEHTSELQSRRNLACRPLLEKKNKP